MLKSYKLLLNMARQLDVQLVVFGNFILLSLSYNLTLATISRYSSLYMP